MKLKTITLMHTCELSLYVRLLPYGLLFQVISFQAVLFQFLL